MKFKNIEVHNVAELVDGHNGGASWLRFPKSVAEKFEGGKDAYNVARYGTGVELRFVINSGENATIRMRKFEDDDVNNAFQVFRGSIQGGWNDSVVDNCVGKEPKDFVIKRSVNLDALRKMRPNDGFSPEVVRFIFDRGRYELLDVIGDVRPPEKSEVPEKKILFYGSSITHGSNALDMSHSFASIIGSRLNYDVYNLGMAGHCRIEHETIDYVSSLEWNIAVIELGINVLDWEMEKVAERVDYVLENIAKKHSDKPIFMISPFYCDNDFLKGGVRSKPWRSTMEQRIRKANLPNVTYINGLDILDGPKYLCSDVLHPNIEGVQKIADDLFAIISREIKKCE